MPKSHQVNQPNKEARANKRQNKASQNFNTLVSSSGMCIISCESWKWEICFFCSCWSASDITVIHKMKWKVLVHVTHRKVIPQTASQSSGTQTFWLENPLQEHHLKSKRCFISPHIVRNKFSSEIKCLKINSYTWLLLINHSDTALLRESAHLCFHRWLYFMALPKYSQCLCIQYQMKWEKSQTSKSPLVLPAVMVRRYLRDREADLWLFWNIKCPKVHERCWESVQSLFIPVPLLTSESEAVNMTSVTRAWTPAVSHVEVWGFRHRVLNWTEDLLSCTPASGIPWAFCTRAWSTSLAETKKMRSLACARSTTPSSSTRKLVHRSICCLRTWHSNVAFYSTWIQCCSTWTLQLLDR